MPLDTSACLRLLEELARHDKIRKNVSSSLRNGLIVGTSTVIGSILMGPPGVVAGAALGAGAAYKSSGNYVSIVTAIKELNNQQKARLTEEMNTIVSSLSYEDVLIVNGFLVSGAALSGLTAAAQLALRTGVQSYFNQNTDYTLE